MRAQGYDAPTDHGGLGGSVVWTNQEVDIGYHNRYGAEEEDHEYGVMATPRGPLNNSRQADLSYRGGGGVFRD